MTALRLQRTHPLMTLSRLETANAIPHPKAPAAAAGAMGLDSVETGARDAAAVRLSRGIARGERACLDEFYRVWFERAFATARALSRRDEAFCLDVVQDAMMRVIKSLAPLPTAAALEAWMHAAIRSACIDALRSEARRLLRERRAGGAAAVASSELPDGVDAVLTLLQELDPASRELLRLRYERDQTLAATAGALGLSPGATHGKVRRLLGWMKERIDS